VDGFQDVGSALLRVEAEMDCAVFGTHTRQLNADQTEALNAQRAADQKGRVEIEVRFGRLGNDPPVQVEYLGAEHYQVDLAVGARPFEDGLVEANHQTGHGTVDGILDRAANGPSEIGPSEAALQNRPGRTTAPRGSPPRSKWHAGHAGEASIKPTLLRT